MSAFPDNFHDEDLTDQRSRPLAGQTGCPHLDGFRTSSFRDFRAIPASEDPAAHYEAMRSHGPVFKVDMPQRQGAAWVVCGYKAAEEVLKGSNYVSQRPAKEDQRIHEDVAQLDSAYDYRSRWVLHQEGEPHAALRALFSEPLTPQAVQASAGTVRTICLELFTQALREGALEGAPGISEFCLVEKVARPFPLKVFCSLFELSDLEHIFSPEDITALATGAASAGPLLNATKAAKKVLSEKKTALEQAIASSVWGKKVLAASEVSQVSATLLANVIFYLLAGHETTGGLLGNLVETMIKKPEVWREVQKDYFNANGELIKKALSEVLRYEPPVRTNVRHVVKDHLLEGQEIKSGDVMIVSITAANRDPSQFGADAAEFNIHRSKGLGLAFGAGTHFCHGTHLALLEAKTFLKVALDHVDHFEFIDQRKPERLKDLTFGSFTKFPVRAIARQYS